MDENVGWAAGTQIEVLPLRRRERLGGCVMWSSVSLAHDLSSLGTRGWLVYEGVPEELGDLGAGPRGRIEYDWDDALLLFGAVHDA